MDWRGRNREEIPGSKCSMYVWLYTDLLQALKVERLSFVFSPDGTLISASAAPHCGVARPPTARNYKALHARERNQQSVLQAAASKVVVCLCLLFFVAFRKFFLSVLIRRSTFFIDRFSFCIPKT